MCQLLLLMLVVLLAPTHDVSTAHTDAFLLFGSHT